MNNNDVIKLPSYRATTPFHSTLKDQGQTVEISYAAALDDTTDEPVIVRRVYDRSNPHNIKYFAYEFPEDADEFEFQPWNYNPRLGNDIGECLITPE